MRTGQDQEIMAINSIIYFYIFIKIIIYGNHPSIEEAILLANIRI